MTSQTDLPLIPWGIIWDGVTEYQDIVPPPFTSVVLLRMVDDGTRRFTEFLPTPHPATRPCAPN